ncbi:MAG: protein kinase [Acidobacteriia bacterium]|nr:protein kinase [Terriglobia bacterium]
MSFEFNPTPELWARIQSLFDRMVDSEAPLALLEEETDAEVRKAVEHLYGTHLEASKAGFLEEPITLVGKLTAPEQARFQPGQILLDRFVIEKLVGKGGMGEVYLAYDKRLSERVALKTIRGDLSSDTSLRRRFVAEVQNSRRVTHPNVCRIFDLFEEDATLFFSMQYLEGTGLSEWLAGSPPAAAVRRQIALQLAQGLHAAHCNGILHCDFKPSNIVLVGGGTKLAPVITDFGLARALTGRSAPNLHSLEAGTPDYMAPELEEGAAASVRTDVYAFGKVLALLMPGARMVAACTAWQPADRPESLEPVIRSLQGDMTRRLVLAGAVAAPLAAIAGYELWNRPRLALVSRQRLAFNAFLPAEGSKASLVRDLLITAIRQSLLVSLVPDEHLRDVLRKLNLPNTLPVAHSHLVTAAANDGIALVAEGRVVESGGGVNFVLQVYDPGRDKPLLKLAEQASDARQVIPMADRVSLQLRREFGESAAALKAGYAPLDQVTSPDAAAVEYYYRGLRLYDNSEAEAAIEWFEQATRIDPQFALAHLWRGIACGARWEVETAMPSYERAYALRQRVSERERLWIEASYHNITADYVSSLEVCRRLAALYPDDPTFQRNVAFAYAYLGRSRDGIAYNRRSVELDPNNNNISELINNHAQANLNDEALDLFHQARGSGNTSTLLEWGAGLAWMGKGDYDSARQAFERMGQDARRDRWSRVVRCEPWIMQGRFADVASDLESDLAFDAAVQEQNHRQIRLSWLGMLEWLMDAPARTRVHASELVRLSPTPAVLQPLLEGGLLAAQIEDRQLASDALERLREIERRWPSTHTHGTRALLESMVDSQNAAALLNQAVGLWPDPLTLYAQARHLARGGDFPGVLNVCDRLEEQRGLIYKRYFPGLAVLGWIEQARALTHLSRFEEARRVYQRIGAHWLKGPREYNITRAVRGEIEIVNHSLRGAKSD